MCIQVYVINLYTNLFVDDQVFLAEEQEGITYMINKLVQEFTQWILEITGTDTQ